MSTRISDKGELYNCINSLVPTLDDNCKLTTISRCTSTSNNMDAAINATLKLDKEYTDLYNALKPFAEDANK